MCIPLRVQRYTNHDIHLLTHAKTGLLKWLLWMPPVHVRSDKHSGLFIGKKSRFPINIWYHRSSCPLSSAQPTLSLSPSHTQTHCPGLFLLVVEVIHHIFIPPLHGAPQSHPISPHHICQNISLTLTALTFFDNVLRNVFCNPILA